MYVKVIERNYSRIVDVPKIMMYKRTMATNINMASFLTKSACITCSRISKV